MTLSLDANTILLGLNIVVTVGGFIKMALALEHRLTKLETMLDVHDVYITSEKRKAKQDAIK